ncbi:hypothetical protein [Pseudomonas lurida]|uniref:hypothetical protein n=1 Tax=Pseudomonas lurida TaxID=244566 RepID=UPI001781DB4B|nr:hypothetical protein [Pseudomonas lurida]MBD8671662.1 hypothetical protein [Pseudomonas lurida]
MFKNFAANKPEPMQTPLGEVVFTISSRDRNGIPEHSVIINHTESGVMALSFGKDMDGDSSKRMACADAACDLFLTVQAVKHLTSEASV